MSCCLTGVAKCGRIESFHNRSSGKSCNVYSEGPSLTSSSRPSSNCTR